MDNDAKALLGISTGGLGSLAVAMALVPARGHVATVNVALVLVLVILLAAVVGGRRAGAFTALVAAMSFDFFHTRPYGSLKITNLADAETTVLLLVVGIAAGEIALRAERIRRALRDHRRQLTSVHRVAQLAAGGDAVDDLVLVVTAELTEVLHLQECLFERPPFVGALPRIESNGTITGGEYRFARGGFELPRAGVELPVVTRGATRGRFVLHPTRGVGVSLEQRMVAVALADQLGVVLGRMAA